jgi:hypothetical protein
MQKDLRMRRIVIVFLATAVTAGGCSSLAFRNPFAAKPDPNRTELTQAEWAKLRRDDARRLVGEGLPPAPGAATRPSPAVGDVGEFLGFVKQIFYVLPKNAINLYLGNTPGKYARMMEDDKSADVRRTGILRLAADYEFARGEPYTKRYWQIAQGDPNPLVRAAAIRALNRSRDASVVPVAVRYLDDADPVIRLEAAKALANLKDPKAVPALTQHMIGAIQVKGEGNRPEPQAENRDVRVACADALRNFPSKEVAKSLVDVLREKEFEVSYQARKSLTLMTGHDFRYDAAKWREYLDSPNPFKS